MSSTSSARCDTSKTLPRRYPWARKGWIPVGSVVGSVVMKKMTSSRIPARFRIRDRGRGLTAARRKLHVEALADALPKSTFPNVLPPEARFVGGVMTPTL